MKAVVWHGTGDIRLDEVPDPRMVEPSDVARARTPRRLLAQRDTANPNGPGAGTCFGQLAIASAKRQGAGRVLVPRLLDLVVSGVVDPTALITRHEPPVNTIEAYETFDRREDGGSRPSSTSRDRWRESTRRDGRRRRRSTA